MNSTVIDNVRGVNRVDAFLNNQPAGLLEVDPAELQAVEGGLAPIWGGLAGALYLGYLLVTSGGRALA
jgi:lactobin A/cerein 7B family class IIb bacteriocin